jgi:hypothetical protein
MIRAKTVAIIAAITLMKLVFAERININDAKMSSINGSMLSP